MKKMLFLALAAAGMLTACSNEDNLGGNGEELAGQPKIQLGVSSNVGVSTRGTGTVGDLTGENNVWAGQDLWVYMLQKGSMELGYYKTPEEINGNLAGTAVFDNEKFTAPKMTVNEETGNEEGVSSGIASTVSGKIAYYPVSGNYDFWGYRVDDAIAGATPDVKLLDAEGNETQDAANAVKRVVDININGSQDIMAGKAEPSQEEIQKLGQYTDNFYSAFAARKDVQPNINFKHLLSRFTFEVRAGSKAAAGKGAGVNTEAVRVTGISVNSKTAGQLTVAHTDAVASDPVLTFAGNFEDVATPLALMQRDQANSSHNEKLVPLREVELTWPLDDQDQPKDTDDEGQPITTGDVISVGEALLVAPGEASYPLTIDLAQKIVKNIDGTVEEQKLQQKSNIKIDGVKTFEAGKSYKVTITVYGLEEIVVTATLQPWENGGSIDIDDDRDPNNGIFTEPTE